MSQSKIMYLSAFLSSKGCNFLMVILLFSVALLMQGCSEPEAVSVARVLNEEKSQWDTYEESLSSGITDAEDLATFLDSLNAEMITAMRDIDLGNAPLEFKVAFKEYLEARIAEHKVRENLDISIPNTKTQENAQINKSRQMALLREIIEQKKSELLTTAKKYGVIFSSEKDKYVVID